MRPPSPPRDAAHLAFLCLLAIVTVMPLVPATGAWMAGKGLLFVGLSVLGTLAVLVDGRRGRRAPALGTPTDAAFYGWLACALPGLLLSVNPGMSHYRLGLLVALGLTYLLAIKVLRRPRYVRLVLLGALFTGLVISVLGLTGYGRYLADGAEPRALSEYLATALFAHSYLAAQYLVMVLVGGIVFLVAGGVAGGRRTAVALALVPIATFVLAIASRGAYLAVAIALITSALLRVRARAEGGRRTLAMATRAAAWIVAALLVLGAGAALGWLPEAASYGVDRVLMLFQPERSDFNYSRLDIWRSTLDLSADHLLFGVGLGAYDTALPAYHASARPVPHAHNQLLHVLAEMGVLGLIAFLLLLRQAAHAARKGAAYLVDDADRHALFHAAVAALVAAAVYFLFETPLHWVESGSLIVVLLAVVTRAGCTTREAPLVPARAWGAVGLTVVLLAVAAPSWWRYVPATLRFGVAEREHGLAFTAQAEGDTDAARRHWELAVEELAAADTLFPYRPTFSALAADILYRQLKRPADALHWARIADERTPGTALFQLQIGHLLMSLGRPGDAIPHLAAAIEANPGYESVEIYRLLGRCYAMAGYPEEAWFIVTDLIERASYYRIHPRLLLDAAALHVQLDRDLVRAAQMLEMYRRAVPGGEEEIAWRALSQQVEELRGRRKRWGRG